MRVKKSILSLVAIAVAVSFCVPAITASAQESGKVELKLELPKPQFTGTPRDIKLGRPDPSIGKTRKPFFVPEGTKLLSLNKPVTSSDEFPIIGDLEFVTDGDKEAADGSFVELGLDSQQVTIDLEEEVIVDAVVIWHFHSEARAYYDVIVQISSEPDFKEGVTTIYNNDYDSSNTTVATRGRDYEYIETNEGRIIDGKATKGRYVRCWSTGNTTNDMNHYIEVEVWGRPVE